MGFKTYKLELLRKSLKNCETFALIYSERLETVEKTQISNCRWRYANFGDTVRCDAGEIVQGQCSSGLGDDCGKNKFSGIYCCEAQ